MPGANQTSVNTLFIFPLLICPLHLKLSLYSSHLKASYRISRHIQADAAAATVPVHTYTQYYIVIMQQLQAYNVTITCKTQLQTQKGRLQQKPRLLSGRLPNTAVAVASDLLLCLAAAFSTTRLIAGKPLLCRLSGLLFIFKYLHIVQFLHMVLCLWPFAPQYSEVYT